MTEDEFARRRMALMLFDAAHDAIARARRRNDAVLMDIEMLKLLYEIRFALQSVEDVMFEDDCRVGNA